MSDLKWIGLLRACELLEPECLVQMLKAVKHLSMNATLLEVLQNANALEILIRILDEQSSGPHSTVGFYIFEFGDYRLHVLALGNLQSCIPDMLQPLSFEQDPSRRSCASRHHTLLETGHRDKLATKAIRTTNPVRFGECWKELPNTFVAARWSDHVLQITGRSIFPSQCFGIGAILAPR